MIQKRPKSSSLACWCRAINNPAEAGLFYIMSEGLPDSKAYREVPPPELGLSTIKMPRLPGHFLHIYFINYYLSPLMKP